MGDIYRYTRNTGGSMYGVIHMQRIGGDRKMAILRPPLVSLGFLRPTVAHLRPTPVVD